MPDGGPERRREAVEHAREQGISERRACRLVDQPRGTQRYQPLRRIDEDPLTQVILTLASEYGRYGYLRPQHRNHVWSYDFVEARTHDGRSMQLLTLPQ